jgi:hypothetical protein
MKPRTTIRREMSGSYTLVVDHVSFTLSELTLRQLAQQVLEQLQRTAAKGTT